MDDKTLRYYEENAESFGKSTLNADMSDARGRFLELLPSHASVLDFGCGSGRDAKAFKDLGYRVEACDGSEELCLLASEWAGIPVRTMLFQDLSEVSRYDGIWACASILHLNKEELKDVLFKIARALKPDGILYTSFKYGTFEGIRNGRYFTDFTMTSLERFLKDIPESRTIETWVTKDVRPERKEEKWLNILARRV
jgi:2-polyprenyl-3-methyl-5-hydroxy-6-metoxy-1,4-benzoquinol methylase